MNTRTTLGELVRARPHLAGVFDRLQLDYCCGGQRSLADACAERGLDADTVALMLESMPAAAASDDESDVAGMDLQELVDHIEGLHHAYLKSELPRLTELAARVRDAHGDRHPELVELERVIGGFRAEIESHLAKEEQILFPAVRAFARASEDDGASGRAHHLEGPLRVMETEHEQAGELLATMRRLTGDHATPDDACESWRALVRAIAELERDTHRHIHKENNVLFPRLRSGPTAQESDSARH
ncbi:MAG: iron-sulfur cluster repair di-iron protein [Candidatus Krumholzibacteriia bacterium]